MNDFLNPLLNPNPAKPENPAPDVDEESSTAYEGRSGDPWTDNEIIASLNHLIRMCHDGQEGYLQSAEHVKSAWLQGLFQSFSTQREQFATELANLVSEMGAEPVAETSVGGALHRTWMILRTAITGDTNDDVFILDECEQGEDATIAAYESELNKGLPEHIHRVVQNQYQDILRAHDQVRETRDAFPY